MSNKKVEDKKVIFLDIESRYANEVIDSTFQKGGKFVYLHGFNNIIPKLEESLSGKKVGEEAEVSVSAKDAFGEYDESLITKVPKDYIPEENLKLNEQLTFNGPDGTVHVYISNIYEDDVELNGNHPFAGKDINFTYRVLDIKEAHKDEIKHKRPNPVLHNIMVEDSSI